MSTIAALTRARLVRQEAGYELCHDILFTQWPELRKWVEEEKSFIVDMDDLERRTLRWERKQRAESELISSPEDLERFEVAVKHLEPRRLQLPIIDDFMEQSRIAVGKNDLRQGIERSDMERIAKALRDKVTLDETDIKKLQHQHFYYALYPDSAPGNFARMADSFSRSSETADANTRAIEYFDASKLIGSAPNGFKVQHFAALAGHVWLLKHLSSLGADLEKQSERGSTPFHLAAYGGHLQAVQWFVDRAADKAALIHSSNSEKATAVLWAAQQGHAGLVTWLCDNGADPNQDTDKRSSALHLAAYRGHTASVLALLKAGARPDARRESGCTPLRDAAYGGQPECVTALLSAAADVNVVDTDGWTPLEASFRSDDEAPLVGVRLEVRRRLLAAGASPSRVDENTKATPLHRLVAQSNVTADEVRQLLDAGARTDMEDRTGDTPLVDALRQNASGIAQVIVEHLVTHGDDKARARGAIDLLLAKSDLPVSGLLGTSQPDLSVRTGRGLTVLHAAALANATNIIASLLEVSPDSANSADQSGDTPLHSAAGAGSLDALEALVAAKSAIDARNSNGDTPLIVAGRSQQYAAMSALIAHGADIHSVNQSGENALVVMLRPNATALRWGHGFPRDLRRRQRDPAEEAVALQNRDAMVEQLVSGGCRPPRWREFKRDENGRVVGIERVSGQDFATRAMVAYDATDTSSWPIAPLVRGAWTALPPEQARTAIAKLWDGATDLHLDIDAIEAARSCRVPYYADTSLIEARLTERGEFRGYLTFLLHPKVDDDREVTLLGGTSPPVHDLNAKLPIRLSSTDVAMDYLRFFGAAVHAEGGAFRLVEGADQLRFHPAMATADRSRAETIPHTVALLQAEPDDKSGWRFSAIVNYSHALFKATFRVQETGMVEMLEDHPLAANLSIEVHRFRDGARQTELVLLAEAPEFTKDEATGSTDASPREERQAQVPVVSEAKSATVPGKEPPKRLIWWLLLSGAVVGGAAWAAYEWWPLILNRL